MCVKATGLFVQNGNGEDIQHSNSLFNLRLLERSVTLMKANACMACDTSGNELLLREQIIVCNFLYVARMCKTNSGNNDGN